ncbi:23S rRNA pseudouridine(2604) synthase RluF [Hymenobacter busanensis]|uniref:Pseudouridine synthase n=1 Tax=Hymenobacter busanensis TaxID=2607656 RepID=A0A7L4ZZN5_9BACT|nr:23S rRNA pseudouridine(2604) synthase RluF [Hymenobacter busanensis]KAA9339298.1 23S rRNA pseudouridine(2604) synthase RluF [Hymenobacter busanensis]QHJ06940.1 23S rRNA pseudouridine(2604) synthase RluF [Hymenobacter busanensis]
MSTRLNKYISESGICSRREADRFIEQGVVFINGKRAHIGDQVTSKDRVVVNGNRIEPRAEEDAIYIAFNKPPGITTTTERGVKDNIIRYIKHSERIFPIGRLDKDSQGLILLTSNGDIVNKILRAGNEHEKEYIVMVDKPITEAFLEGMRQGVPMLGTITKKCEVQKETNYIFRITLIQGLNRQIRRMAEYFGYEVVQLERIRVMNITLKGLGVGDWRELTEKELSDIFAALETSSGTASRRTSGTKTAHKMASQEWLSEAPRPKAARPAAGARAAAKPAAPGTKKPGRATSGKPRTTTAGKPATKPAGKAAGKPAGRAPQSAPGGRGRTRTPKR